MHFQQQKINIKKFPAHFFIYPREENINTEYTLSRSQKIIYHRNGYHHYKRASFLTPTL